MLIKGVIVRMRPPVYSPVPRFVTESLQRSGVKLRGFPLPRAAEQPRNSFSGKLAAALPVDFFAVANAHNIDDEDGMLNLVENPEVTPDEFDTSHSFRRVSPHLLVAGCLRAPEFVA